MIENRRVNGGVERRRRVIGEGRKAAEKEEEVAMKQPGLTHPPAFSSLLFRMYDPALIIFHTLFTTPIHFIVSTYTCLSIYTYILFFSCIYFISIYKVILILSIEIHKMKVKLGLEINKIRIHKYYFIYQNIYFIS